MRRLLFAPPLAAAALTMLGIIPALAEPGLQSSLVAASGQGSGEVEVSPTAHDAHDTVFIAQGTAAIHDALPDTMYLVQRAVDFTPGDGTCDIAPAPPVGWLTLTTLITSPVGAGAAHFVRMSGPDPRGFQFDLVFRVVRENPDGTPDQSQLLMSSCMTVTAK